VFHILKSFSQLFIRQEDIFKATTNRRDESLCRNVRNQT